VSQSSGAPPSAPPRSGVSLRVKQRLDELGLEQRELARAADVTESYISQLLSRRRPPPAPNRTDIYDKMERLLKLPRGELATLAAHERLEHLERELGEETVPLFADVRALILRKCHRNRRPAVEAIFEQQPFGELERLVTGAVLDLVRRITKEQLANEHWLRTVAKLSGRNYQEVRVVALEFLDTDMMHVSPENCVAFLDPFIESWDIDLLTFDLKIALNPRVSPQPAARFEFTEQPANAGEPERGFVEFIEDRSLSGSATKDELAFLERLPVQSRRPTALFYYRVLQDLRDPLHFRAPDTWSAG
jgi:transcriptional regulator with XRE-family HTH domain